jgi:glycosyltransferase involved in cell wall biosynthesis
MEWATRLVVLQPLGLRELPRHLRARGRVIYQTVPRVTAPLPRPGRTFDVCVAGHLRPVKDPFRAALAARRLPATSRIRILQAGAALSPAMARRARAEEGRNPRYRWLGPLPRWRLRRLMAQCRLLVLSSKLEGGANVVSEAVAARLPILASRVAGNAGLLGEGYPGYFPCGDTRALARLLERSELEPAFLRKLRIACARLAPRLTDRAGERRSWARLLAQCTAPSLQKERQTTPSATSGRRRL